MLVAPDYAAALVGWRSWTVVSAGGELVLCSPLYLMLWLPGEEVVASCRTRRWAETAWPRHPAPEQECRCGIYAGHAPQLAVSYVSGPSFARQLHRVEQPVFGKVSLWGQVVECEAGWRGQRAYPKAIYVPALPGKRARESEDDAPPRPAETIAEALSTYGVPVELIACETLRQAAEQLQHHG